jgi:hypothetical protein
MATKKVAYVNRFTGEVKITTRGGGKHLNEDWGKVQFVKNQEGEPVMRIELEGATADISAVETQEVEPDVVGNAE